MTTIIIKITFIVVTLALVSSNAMGMIPFCSRFFSFHNNNNDEQIDTTALLFGVRNVHYHYNYNNKHSFIVRYRGGGDGSSAIQTKKKALERGKLLPDNFNVSDMFQAYRDIQKDYYEKAFHPDDDATTTTTSKRSGWEILNTKDDIEIAMLQHPSDPSCPYVKMKARVPVPVDDCWNFLQVREWDKSMPLMDPFYEGVSVYGEYEYNDENNSDDNPIHTNNSIDSSDNDTNNDSNNNNNNQQGLHRIILCRKRTKRIFMYGKRDLAFLSVTQEKPENDGTRVSGTVSVINNHLLPRQKGYTRAFQDSIAFYKPIDNNTKTDLTIVCRIDLNDSGEDGTGGYMPMWFYVKTIGQTAAMSMARMKKALIEQQQQTRLADQEQQ